MTLILCSTNGFNRRDFPSFSLSFFFPPSLSSSPATERGDSLYKTNEGSAVSICSSTCTNYPCVSIGCSVAEFQKTARGEEGEGEEQERNTYKRFAQDASIGYVRIDTRRDLSREGKRKKHGMKFARSRRFYILIYMYMYS